MKDWTFVKFEVDQRIGRVILNRPDKRNALNALFVTELKEVFSLAFADEDVKVIVLEAAGDAFCAGADLGYLQELQKNTYEENLADSKHLMELFKMIYESPKVVIACLEGHAIAGGAGLATVCDFVFSVPDAKFSYSEVKIGFIPAIVSVFLLRKVGESQARKLLLTGEIISAKAAKDLGLFHYICEAEEIRSEVTRFAEGLCKSASGDSLRLTRELIAKVQDMSYEEGFNFASEMNAKARETKDCKAGIAAFLNKEKLTW